ncbi:acyl carrier mitochondrial isoform X1 [Brachionus plicatilis]|uniref:Acyl carrier protein n=1 Tax=Brachionus plicatilis TaxID=10195 RepID=A0A3M7RYN5_BRAPC|nr:acyl carrier mitochondrial isoform X1 [Brachionus plicatilis]
MNTILKSSRLMTRGLVISNYLKNSSRIVLLNDLNQKKYFSSQILNKNLSKLANSIDKQNYVIARSYSHVPYTRDMIEQRVLFVLKMCDKVDVNKLNLKSHFSKDLGLDSLDQVDVVIAMEDEFGFEIPDEDGEFLMTPADIVQYVCDKYDVFD